MLLGLLPFALPLRTGAQDTEAPKTRVGPVDIKFDRADANPSLVHLIGHARVTSDDYDFYAADIKLIGAPAGKAKSPGLGEAVAEGGAMPGTQVIAHIRRPLDSVAFEIYSDRAVYRRDLSRPSGGVLTFTGQVKVITKSGFLAVPSVTTTDKAEILLGAGPDYPQLQSGPGHISLTPAQ